MFVSFFIRRYNQEVRVDPGMIFVFGEHTFVSSKLPLKSWLLGVTLICVFSLDGLFALLGLPADDPPQAALRAAWQEQ